jgi:hypothetical protein
MHDGFLRRVPSGGRYACTVNPAVHTVEDKVGHDVGGMLLLEVESEGLEGGGSGHAVVLSLAV